MAVFARKKITREPKTYTLVNLFKLPSQFQAKLLNQSFLRYIPSSLQSLLINCTSKQNQLFLHMYVKKGGNVVVPAQIYQ